MSKFSIYILLILTFLGLSQGPYNKNRPLYITSERSLPRIFKEIPPFSVVLVDAFSTGIIIRSHYHKYRLITPNKHPQTAILQVSKDFFDRNVSNIGMAIYQQNLKKENILVPMPPIAIYIGLNAYGHWVSGENDEKVWKFHRAYAHLDRGLSSEDFKITEEFYQSVQFFRNQKLPFYGQNNEFGTTGSLTPKLFPEFFNKKNEDFSVDIKEILKRSLKIKIRESL
ncbi:MAG: hypothetical protein HQK53_01900 [Oligoflexia bacterium]|nr:hypothetical protein [Oligoflexia bacterium]